MNQVSLPKVILLWGFSIHFAHCQSINWHFIFSATISLIFSSENFYKFNITLQTANWISTTPLKNESSFFDKVYLAMGIFHSFCTLSKHQLIPFTKEVLTPWNWCMRNYFQGNRIHVLSMWSLLTRARKNKKYNISGIPRLVLDTNYGLPNF